MKKRNKIKKAFGAAFPHTIPIFAGLRFAELLMESI